LFDFIKRKTCHFNNQSRIKPFLFQIPGDFGFPFSVCDLLDALGRYRGWEIRSLTGPLLDFQLV